MLFVIKLQKLLLTFFCNCDIVKPNWEALVQVIKAKHDIDLDLSTFDKLFGVHLDKYIMFICYMSEILYQCILLKTKGKLSTHLKKMEI